MPSLVPGALGLIEIEPSASRLDKFLGEGDDGDCVGELVRIARGVDDREAHADVPADTVLPADTEQLAKELEAEYAAVRAAIRRARR